MSIQFVRCTNKCLNKMCESYLLKELFKSRLTRRVPLVEQVLLTLPEYQSSPPVFSGVRVTRSLVLYVCFVDHCSSFCTFSVDHCVVCSSSIYGFWLPLWYLQTLPTHLKHILLSLYLFAFVDLVLVMTCDHVLLFLPKSKTEIAN
jgi:hypothetical protein